MNIHLDLSKVYELALKNIEEIDLNGNLNELALELRNIIASSDPSNTLMISVLRGLVLRIQELKTEAILSVLRKMKSYIYGFIRKLTLLECSIHLRRY